VPAARHHDPIAYGLLITMAVCFAGTWVAARWATDEVPPLTTAFLRFCSASILLLGWARVQGVRIRVGRDDLSLVVAMGVTGIVAYNLCFLYGVRLAPSSDGAVIVPGLSPLVLVMGPGLTGPGDRALGDGLYALGALCWGAYSVLSRAATLRLHPVTATLAATAFGAAVFAPLALLEGGWEPLLAASPRALASVGYLGALGTVVAFVAFSEGIRRIGAPRASAFIVLVPLLGEVLSAWLLGESVGGFVIGGTAVVLGGLWLVQTARPAARRQVAIS
jgi:drug/metabolite transporter (DMT)-like permease